MKNLAVTRKESGKLKGRAVRSVMAAVATVSQYVGVAHATSATATDIISRMATMCQSLYNLCVANMWPFVGTAFGICVLLAIFSKDDRTVDGAFKWGKRIVIGTLIFLCLPAVLALIKTISGVTSAGSLSV